MERERKIIGLKNQRKNKIKREREKYRQIGGRKDTLEEVA